MKNYYIIIFTPHIDIKTIKIIIFATTDTLAKVDKLLMKHMGIITISANNK
jgi:hypothetical protein